MPLSPHQISNRSGQARRQEWRGSEAKVRHMSPYRERGKGGGSLPGTNMNQSEIQTHDPENHVGPGGKAGV